MSTYGSIIPGASRLAGVGPSLSKAAKHRLKWMEYYEAHGRNASKTCRYFGISRTTFHRWRARYDPANLRTLEERPRRPKRVRRPQRPPKLVEAVRQVREQYPRWGKDKLVIKLRERGWQVSTSMVGRILTDLRHRGVLVELPRGSRARKQAAARPYAVRKPKDYMVEAPGDLVQLDTQTQHPEPGVTLRHFGARDAVSRWDVLAVHTRATAALARDFLAELLERMPFPVKALQIDGGSEWKAEFEAACAERGLPLFVLPPKSPKLNGRVERSHRTHEEEFYQCYGGDLTVAALRPALHEWEGVYNTARPQQALGYLTPAQWLARWRADHENGAARDAPAAAPFSV